MGLLNQNRERIAHLHCTKRSAGASVAKRINGC